jgi:hypothetical protein
MKTIAVIRPLAMALLAAACVSSSIAAESKQTKAALAMAAFEKLKGLAGEWTGEFAQEGKKQEAAVVYKTTSNGTVVMETLFPGTRHEMITMFYLEEDQLVLVHYCAAGNQPKMLLKTSSADRLEFDYAGGSNVRADKDSHMHALRLTFDGKDKLTSDWDYFKDGKRVETTKFSFARKAA